MTVFIDLLRVLASLAWPAVLVTLLILYRKEIRALLELIPRAMPRVKGGDIFGVKFELRELQEETKQASSDVQLVNLTVTSEASVDTAPPVQPLPSPTQVGVDEQTKATELSARDALNLVSKNIQREMKLLFAAGGTKFKFDTPMLAVGFLRTFPQAPRSLINSLTQFFSIVSDPGQESNETIEAVVTAGLALLNTIKSIPRGRYEVIFADVLIFSDPDCSVLIRSGVGVMLRSFDANGRSSSATQIFPTTRKMVAGTSVGWEWNMSLTWTDAWYRHPATKEIHTAWSSAAEFIGQDLNLIE